jgi:hypothetical protein
MYIYKLNKGKELIFKQWTDYLNSRIDEVKIELKHENCSREFFHIFEIKDEYYAIGHMEGENIKKARDNELNNKHKEILKECFEKRIESQKLYDISINQ